LIRPYLIQKCYVPEDVGLATATIGLICLITGTLVGGASTERIGLTRALWIFGALQDVGFLGQVLVDHLTPGSPCAGGVIGAVIQPMSHRFAMYGAIALENLCQGLATGAFGVLLLRMTERKFSATQYALFSSLFALPRLLAGPISGFLVDAIGWPSFFLVSLTMGIPGLVMLARFAPPGVREPQFTADDTPPAGPPLGAASLAGRGIAGGLALGVAGLLIVALLAALKTLRETKGARFGFGDAVLQALQPAGIGGWLQIVGIVAFAIIGGLLVAAVSAARRGGGEALSSASDLSVH